MAVVDPAMSDVSPGGGRRRFRRICSTALAALALAATTLVATPGATPGAVADTVTDAVNPGYRESTNSLLTRTLRAAGGGPWQPVLRLPSIAARKGQKFYLQARLATTSNVARGPMIGARIVCLATGGGGGSPYTTRNHAGRDGGIRTVSIRWIFRAPADNTYRCEVRGRADTSINPEVAALTVQSSSFLRARSVSTSSRQWAVAKDACVGQQRIPAHPQCGSVREKVTVLDRTIRPGRTFAAGADVELTREYGNYPGGTARVRTTLTVVQLRADGRQCASPRRTSTDRAIDSNLHHVKVHLTVPNVIRSGAAGCTDRFRARVHVRLLSGNPVLIHNKVYSNAFTVTT